MSRHDRPNFTDVRWDHGAAEASIGALRRAADEIERSLAEGAAVALTATSLWLGPHRHSFDLRRRALDLEARELAADCRAAAGKIAAADRRAREEQARREREREVWRQRERERERQRHAQSQL